MTTVLSRRPVAPDSEVLAEVSRLVTGIDPERLERLRHTVEDPEQFRHHLIQHLAEAAATPHSANQLEAAIEPVLETHLWRQVDRNPERLSEAIAPALGPAITRAVRLAVDGFIERVDQVVQTGLSPRAMLWRFEAWRTGTSFADLVIRKTLRYQVEQVLVIHRDTGLLLVSLGREESDPSLISSMLTALRDFASDAFETTDNDRLEGLRVGSLTLLVEDGAHAALAAAVRGRPPSSLRARLRSSIAEFEGHHTGDLRAFNGQVAPFEESATRSGLAELLEIEAHGPPTQSNHKGIRRSLAAILLLLLLSTVGWTVIRHRARAQERATLEAISATPGMLVAHWDQDNRSALVLRDPLAPPLNEVLTDDQLQGSSLDLRVVHYLSLDPDFVLQRARTGLRPPSTASLALEGTTLRVSGTAPHSWLHQLESRAGALSPGVEMVDTSGVTSLESSQLEEQLSQLNRAAFGFSSESTELNHSEGALEQFEENLETIRHLLSELRSPTLQQPQPSSPVKVLGMSGDEVDPLDRRLAQERLDQLRTALTDPSLLPETVSAVLADEIPCASPPCTHRHGLQFELADDALDTSP